ncbi:metallophosphoesterase MPPED2-like isoform X2 [Mya arenaria]|uniref:metallophosphoesterase MPPED2-like isoform X2 n=1 Tax=Mya arenaria TaxID=6604 RepID=UPI0022E23EA5|nr:metallophosphoesterase MPPED2-like isoform X2 [Mya arenaria]
MASLANFFSQMFSKNENIPEAELIKKPGTGNLKPDINAHKPDQAWSKLKNQQNMANVASLKPGMPMREDRIRFVCISDTHAQLERGAPLEIPQGDVLIHAGDLTMSGEPREVAIVNKYLGTLPHKHKIVIAGNHDMTFDSEFMANKHKSRFFTFDSNDSYQQDLAKYGVKHIQNMLSNCTYIEDSMVQIYGINIYGSPWTVGSGSWGFQRARGSGIVSIWNQIPTNTDILITHMPPLGYGDSVQGTLSVARLKPLFGIPPMGLKDHVGCVDLLRTVQSRVKPTLHVYGHIHEGYGMRTDGTTTFVNASMCTLKYRPINPPLVFDFPLPPGVTKQDFMHFMRYGATPFVTDRWRDGRTDMRYGATPFVTDRWRDGRTDIQLKHKQNIEVVNNTES